MFSFPCSLRRRIFSKQAFLRGLTFLVMGLLLAPSEITAQPTPPPKPMIKVQAPMPPPPEMLEPEDSYPLPPPPSALPPNPPPPQPPSSFYAPHPPHGYKLPPPRILKGGSTNLPPGMAAAVAATAATSKKKEDMPELFLNLLSSQAWINPEEGRSTIFWRAFDVETMWVNRETGLRIGNFFSIARIQSDSWILPFSTSGERISLERMDFLPFSIRMGRGAWWTGAGFLSYRAGKFDIPGRFIRSDLAQKAVKSDFADDVKRILLPFLEAGLRVGGFETTFEANLLSWDFSSFRLRGKTSLMFGHYAMLSLEGAFFQESSSIDWTITTDAKKLHLGLSSWNHSSIEGRLTLDISLFGGLLPKKNVFWGPVILTLGVRARHVFHHRLEGPDKSVLFEEKPGVQWSAIVGLSLQFGHYVGWNETR